MKKKNLWETLTSRDKSHLRSLAKTMRWKKRICTLARKYFVAVQARFRRIIRLYRQQRATLMKREAAIRRREVQLAHHSRSLRQVTDHIADAQLQLHDFTRELHHRYVNYVKWHNFLVQGSHDLTVRAQILLDRERALNKLQPPSLTAMVLSNNFRPPPQYNFVAVAAERDPTSYAQWTASRTCEPLLNIVRFNGRPSDLSTEFVSNSELYQELISANDEPAFEPGEIIDRNQLVCTNRRIMDRFSTLWADTSEFMRRVFEYSSVEWQPTTENTTTNRSEEFSTAERSSICRKDRSQCLSDIAFPCNRCHHFAVAWCRERSEIADLSLTDTTSHTRLNIEHVCTIASKELKSSSDKHRIRDDVSTSNDILFPNDCCSRDSFDARRAVRRSYDPFAWMYRRAGTESIVTYDQRCRIHLNLGPAFDDILRAVHEFRQLGYVSVKRATCLLRNEIVRMCGGSAAMFSILTNVPLRTIAHDTFAELLTVVCDVFYRESELLMFDDTRMRLELHDPVQHMPKFVSERTGALWSMLSERVFYKNILWTLSSLPHIMLTRAHEEAEAAKRTVDPTRNRQVPRDPWSSERDLNYRKYATLSTVIIVTNKLTRTLALDEISSSIDHMHSSFERLMRRGLVCLAVPFSYFCSSDLVEKLVHEAFDKINKDEIDKNETTRADKTKYLLNLYALRHMLRVRDLSVPDADDDDHAAEQHSSVNDVKDVKTAVWRRVEDDLVRVRDEAFAVAQNETRDHCSAATSSPTTSATIGSSRKNEFLSFATLSLRSIALNYGLVQCRRVIEHLETPIDYVVALTNYFRACVWHYISEMPISRCVVYEPCTNCSRCKHKQSPMIPIESAFLNFAF